ncbi:MAG: c-type cytochrome [Phycisphaerae bacterium]
MSNNPYSDQPNVPPQSTTPPAPCAAGAPAARADADSHTLLLVGSFLTLLVVLLLLVVMAFFHHYRHVLEAKKEAGVSTWSAAIQQRQIASIQPHWVNQKRRQATVGIELAEDMVVAQYTPGAKPVLLPAVASASSVPSAAKVPLHVLGAKLYASLGCIGCHTVNGNPGVGPSWKNLAGYPQKLTDGKTVIANYTFLRTMILHPGKLLVVGAPAGVMPASYGPMLSGPKHPHETQLNAIIWYINTLSNRSSKATQPPVPDK